MEAFGGKGASARAYILHCPESVPTSSAVPNPYLDALDPGGHAALEAKDALRPGKYHRQPVRQQACPDQYLRRLRPKAYVCVRKRGRDAGIYGSDDTMNGSDPEVQSSNASAYDSAPRPLSAPHQIDKVTPP
eukprot:2971018-Rhodomonas_salina.2